MYKLNKKSWHVTFYKWLMKKDPTNFKTMIYSTYKKQCPLINWEEK